MRTDSDGDKNGRVAIVDKMQKYDKVCKMPNSVSFKRDMNPPMMKSIGIYTVKSKNYIDYS